MILWLSVIGAVVLVAGTATWMVQRSIERARKGPLRIDRDDAAEDQFGL